MSRLIVTGDDVSCVLCNVSRRAHYYGLAARRGNGRGRIQFNDQDYFGFNNFEAGRRLHKLKSKRTHTALRTALYGIVLVSLQIESMEEHGKSFCTLIFQILN